MCGITGFSLTAQDAEALNAQNLMRSLLYGIENRGKHATGIAWHDTDKHRVFFNKQPQSATQFITGGQNLVPEDARLAIGHTRHGTQGPASNNWNNHPIMINTIIGVHNGMIDNDYQLFSEHKELKRQAEVDSEIIFQLLAHRTTRNGVPLEDPDRIATTVAALEEIRGSMAIAWIDTNHPEALNLAVGAMNPIMLGFTESGSIIFSSTKTALEAAERAHDIKFEKIIDLAEGSLLAFDETNLVVWEQFSPTRRYQHVSYQDWDDYGHSHFLGYPTGRQAKAREYFDSKEVDPPKALDPPKPTTAPRVPYTSANGQRWYPASSGSWTNVEPKDDKVEEEMKVARPRPDMFIDVLAPGLGTAEIACIRGSWEPDLEEEDATSGILFETLEDPLSYELIKWYVAYNLRSAIRYEMDEDIYDRLYADRTINIAAFYNDAVDGPHRKPASQLHGYARPGDEIETQVDGETCRGHIVAMPQTYPLGEYILSVQKPYRTRTGLRWEDQLVFRSWFGFTLISLPDETEETPTDAAATATP